MRLKMRSLFTLSFILFVAGNVNAQGFWPNGKKAAIVLTYDDGLDSQLDQAVPQLNAAGFKGTFFLYSAINENRFSDWKKARELGHEIGNHSLFHPCKNGSSKSPRFSSGDYDIPSILREIETMGKLIFAITGKEPISYAYPCGETEVGGMDYSDSLRNSGLVKYARNGHTSEGITDFQNIDFLKVPAFVPASGCGSQELSNHVTKVLEKGALGIFLFHGVGGDYLSVGAKEHRELLDFLFAHEDEIWVCTFGEAMEYIQQKTN